MNAPFYLVQEPVWKESPSLVLLYLWAPNTTNNRKAKAAFSRRFRRTIFATSDLRNHIKIDISYQDNNDMADIVLSSRTKFGKGYLKRFFEATRHFFREG